MTESVFLSTLVGTVVLLLPNLALVVFSRKHVFDLIVRRLERACSTSDGAFLAELLGDTQLAPGDIYWVHHGENLEQFEEEDPRRNFDQMVIVSVDFESEALHLRPVTEHEATRSEFLKVTRRGGGDFANASQASSKPFLARLEFLLRR